MPSLGAIKMRSNSNYQWTGKRPKPMSQDCSLRCRRALWGVIIILSVLIVPGASVAQTAPKPKAAATPSGPRPTQKSTAQVPKPYPKVDIALVKTRKLYDNCEAFFLVKNGFDVNFTRFVVEYVSYDSGGNIVRKDVLDGRLPPRETAYLDTLIPDCTKVARLKLIGVASYTQINGEYISDKDRTVLIENIRSTSRIPNIDVASVGGAIDIQAFGNLSLDRKLNPLERALNPFGGNRTLVNDFRDAGGVNKFSDWFGIDIQGYNVQFDKDGNVVTIALQVPMETAPLELRQVINDLCGFSESEWKKEDKGGFISGEANNQKCMGLYSPANRNSWMVTVQRK
jgi:hypothetical protein